MCIRDRAHAAHPSVAQHVIGHPAEGQAAEVAPLLRLGLLLPGRGALAGLAQLVVAEAQAVERVQRRVGGDGRVDAVVAVTQIAGALIAVGRSPVDLSLIHISSTWARSWMSTKSAVMPKPGRVWANRL